MNVKGKERQRQFTRKKKKRNPPQKNWWKNPKFKPNGTPCHRQPAWQEQKQSQEVHGGGEINQKMRRRKRRKRKRSKMEKTQVGKQGGGNPRWRAPWPQETVMSQIIAKAKSTYHWVLGPFTHSKFPLSHLLCVLIGCWQPPLLCNLSKERWKGTTMLCKKAPQCYAKKKNKLS